MSSSEPPAATFCSNRLAWLFSEANRNSFSITTVQDQSEASASSTSTAFTTQSARMKTLNSEKLSALVRAASIMDKGSLDRRQRRLAAQGGETMASGMSIGKRAGS